MSARPFHSPDHGGASVFEVLTTLASTPRGLTEQEASERLGEIGENRQPVDCPPTWTDRLKVAVGGPFVALLLGLGVVLGVVGDARGCVTVATMVVLCIGVRYCQQTRSDHAMRALREYTTYTATVRRRLTPDTTPVAYEIPIEDLVPGDVVLLTPGEVIHADLRVIAAQRLRVDQSALSGESLPVEKSAEPVDGERRGPLEGTNTCFAGTSVVSGSGTAVVVATGPRTYWGAATRDSGVARPRTSVDAGVTAVGTTLMRFMLVMIPIVLAVSGAITGDWAQAGLFAVSVAVGLMPELLPVIVAATFLRGVATLTRHRVIVKRLESICDLGAIDVLCLDKTGTLTQDRVAYAHGIAIDGRPDEQVDTYACVAATFQDAPYNQLDAALDDLVDADQHVLLRARFTKIGEAPFDVYQRQSSIVVQERSDEHLVITKGDPDAVLRLCSHAQLDGVVTELSADLAQQGRDLVASLQRNGMRALAIAAKPVAVEPLAISSRLDDSSHEPSGSVLVGFVGFVDPIKATAPAAVFGLDAAGISAKMLTGDAPEVAEHVCRAAGLQTGHIVTGSDIDHLSPDELGELVCRTTVFARVDPQHKARIVSALRTAGHTVGFIGDGINDSSALRLADVGICVDTATDVARHAADLILLDKDLTVVAGAVTEGRRTLGNTMKYVKITTAANVGNAASVLLAGALLPFLPMLPIQLMVQNLLYEITQLALPFDRVDADYLHRPRRWESTGLTSFAIAFGLLSSVFDLVTFAALWWSMDANTVAGQTIFQTGWFLEGLLSQVLVVLVMRSQHGLRTAGTPALSLLGAVIAVVIVGLCLPFTSVAHWVGLVPLPTEFFGWLVLIIGTYLAAAAGLKRWWVRRNDAFP